MDLVKALLVFFILTGCAQIASELPLTHALSPQRPATQLGDAARLGPPNPRGAGARRIDHVANAATVALN